MKAFTVLLIVTAFIGLTLAQSYSYGGNYNRGANRQNRYGLNYRYRNRHGNRYGNRYGGNRYGNRYRNRYGNNYGNNEYGNENYGYECPKLSDPANGDVEITGVNPGDRATYQCDNGHDLVGSSSRKCQQNGQWSGEAPICKRVDCGPLPDIPNGQVDISPDTNIGSSAVYACDFGYVLVGDEKRYCQDDGTWSGQEPICVPGDCGPLPDIPNGRVDISPDTTVGSSAVYTCDFGYVLVGREERYCQTDGTWSGREPECVPVDCGPLSDIPNGRVDISPDTNVGSSAVYTCEFGYILVGEEKRYCQADGTWSGREPECVPVDCGPLPDIPNGRVDISPDTNVGSSAIYTCDFGYILVGEEKRYCQADGTWSGREPECVPGDCGPLPDIPNGRVDISPDTTVGSSAVYTCDFGFVLVGREERYCQTDGTWSGREPECVPVGCGPLPDPLNGQVTIAPDTNFGSVARYSCYVGYVVNGNDRRHCQANGRWSEVEPTCYPVGCGPLQDIPNGRVALTGTAFRNTATYFCNQGHELIGNKIRVCQENGNWDGQKPLCESLDCGLLPAPLGGSVQFNPNTLLDSFAIFTCKPGLKLVGDSQRRCQANGQWSGSQPTCQKIKCQKLGAPVYGKIYTSGYYPGDHAIYSCTNGYSLIGKHRLVCLQSGAWSGAAPSCKEDSYYAYNDDYNNNGHYKVGHGYDDTRNYDYY